MGNEMGNERMPNQLAFIHSCNSARVLHFSALIVILLSIGQISCNVILIKM